MNIIKHTIEYEELIEKMEEYSKQLNGELRDEIKRALDGFGDLMNRTKKDGESIQIIFDII